MVDPGSVWVCVCVRARARARVGAHAHACVCARVRAFGAYEHVRVRVWDITHRSSDGQPRVSRCERNKHTAAQPANVRKQTDKD